MARALAAEESVLPVHYKGKSLLKVGTQVINQSIIPYQYG